MNFISTRKFLVTALALTTLCFTACDDNDDVLGIDLTDNGTVFLSSNTSSMVGVLDVNDDPLEIETFNVGFEDADGIYYDDGDERLIKVDRTNNRLVALEDVLDDMDDDGGVQVEFTSTSDFTNGRGLTAIGNSQFVVAQDGSDDNDGQNAFIVYNFTESDGFERSQTINVDFNLWGLEYVDGTMYAIVDNTDSIAIFNSFFDNPDGSTANPDRFLKVDGLVRTHGLEYDEEDDLMILTDVGEASSDSDGALYIIDRFSTRTGDVITAADYIRIGGDNTMLGNPVDVDYDENDDRIYVAERANDGGLLLIFERTATDNAAPIEVIPFAGISSLYLNRGN